MSDLPVPPAELTAEWYSSLEDFIDDMNYDDFCAAQRQYSLRTYECWYEYFCNHDAHTGMILLLRVSLRKCLSNM